MAKEYWPRDETILERVADCVLTVSMNSCMHGVHDLMLNYQRDTHAQLEFSSNLPLGQRAKRLNPVVFV